MHIANNKNILKIFSSYDDVVYFRPVMKNLRSPGGTPHSPSGPLSPMSPNKTHQRSRSDVTGNIHHCSGITQNEID